MSNFPSYMSECVSSFLTAHDETVWAVSSKVNGPQAGADDAKYVSVQVRRNM